MSKKLVYGAVSAVAILLIAGGTAFAATSGAGKSLRSKLNAEQSIIVTLDSASGTTLTVTAKGTDAAITTVDASSAKIIVNGVAAKASNLANGDRLIVSGSLNGTTSFTATRISDGAASTSLGSGMLNGVVTAVGANTITVSVTEHARVLGKAPTTTTSSVTVTTNKKTRFNVPGVKNAKIVDVAVGGRVTVIGVSSTGTGTARLVTVIPVPQKTVPTTSTSTPTAN